MTQSSSLRVLVGLGVAAFAAACMREHASPQERAPGPAAGPTGSVKVAARPAGDIGDVVADAIVVDFKDGTSAEQIDAWEQGWGVDLELNSIEGEEDGIALAVGVDDVEGALEKIRENPDVESAEPLIQYSIPEPDSFESEALPLKGPDSEDSEGFRPNDPDYDKQWNLKQIHMPKAWQITKGKGAVVAVLDTGIAYET